MTTAAAPIPTAIHLHQHSRILEITFENSEHYELSCEFLRVYSPSAEVRGHTPSQAVLQVEKGNVNIEKITAVGNYAICLHFDDGHNTGIYSWSWLYHLCLEQEQLWQAYLDALQRSGARRFPYGYEPTSQANSES